jgi:hypothetical protein
MVDAGGQEIELLGRDSKLACNELGRIRNAVTHADNPQTKLVEEPRVHGHGIRVVDDERVGGQFANGCGEVLEDGRGAEESEDAAGTEGVANGLVNAIAARHLDIDTVGDVPTHLEGDDDDRSAFNRLSQVRGRLNPRSKRIRRDEPPQDTCGSLDPFRVDVHQGEFGLAQGLEGQDVADQLDRKDEAARSDDGDLHGHAPGTARCK